MLKIYLYNLNFSLELQKKLLYFNTVKTVFVDLKKTQFLLGGHTILPIFLTKKSIEKSWPQPWRKIFCNLSEKFRLYRCIFNTVKSVFVD